MNYRLSKVDRQMAFAFVIGLAIRLCAIPFSMTDEADAVTRIFITLDWMEKPELITSGVWGPLHTYLIAGVLHLWNNPIYAPVVLNSLFSAATAIPLYLFVRREWSETAGLFVACIYLVYPVAIRYGLVALSDIPFIFFIALTLLLLSYARDEHGSWKYALFAGLAITIAGSLRYEAWGLTPFMGLPLLKKWKSLPVFFGAALIFPVFWMAGNYQQFGDPLYSFHWALNWNINIGGLNEGLTTLDILNRATYFPRVLFFGLTPLVFAVCLIGILLVIYKRRKQWVWLIPLFVLFFTFTINAINGNLTTQVRYSLSLAIFMIPFAAEWFENLRIPRQKIVLSILIVGSILPLSYLRSAIPWPFDFPNPIPRKISAIPRVDQQVEKISKFEIEQAQIYPEGLLLDFVDWGDTYYVALMARKPPASIFIMPGEVHEEYDISMLREFLNLNPTGLVLLTTEPRYMQIQQTSNGDQLIFSGFDQSLFIREIGKVGTITCYRYSNMQLY